MQKTRKHIFVNILVKMFFQFSKSSVFCNLYICCYHSLQRVMYTKNTLASIPLWDMRLPSHLDSSSQSHNTFPSFPVTLDISYVLPNHVVKLKISKMCNTVSNLHLGIFPICNCAYKCSYLTFLTGAEVRIRTSSSIRGAE